MNIGNLDLNLLVVLEALLEHRNVSAAARQIGLSQPAVSNALARLRSHFNDPLLVRSRKGMLPTPRAERLAPALRHSMAQLRQTLESADEFDPKKSTTIFRFACMDYVELLLLPPLGHELSTTAPGLRLEMRPLRESIPAKELAAGEVDFAIGYFTEPPGHLYSKVLFEEDFVVVTHKDVSLPATLSLERYTKLKHILVAPWGGMASTVDSLLTKEGLSREVCVSTTHFLVAPMLAAASSYALTLPRRIANTFCNLLPLKQHSLPVKLGKFSFSLLWHERNHHDKGHQWMRQTIQKLGLSG